MAKQQVNLAAYLLDNEAVSLHAEAADWRSAVKLGTDLLEGLGAVTPDYYRDICASTERLGPYFLLAPGIAMPHARPEAGVLENSFALVTLKTPVAFGDADNDPIDILLTMAAKSAKEQNEGAIVQIVELLDNAERVERLRQARSIADLQALLCQL